MGDLNCTPTESTITTLKRCWEWISPNQATYPSSGATKCIDYIFVWKGNIEYQVLSSQVVTACDDIDMGLVTDHLPVCATIRYAVKLPEGDSANDSAQGTFDKLPESEIYAEF
jgi:endonuclease/exonuclease/phosphatase family metal-dependent hydrolase